MEISLCKQLQRICLSERLLQLSYNDPELKLLDSIKKCNIIFHVEEPQCSEYVQRLILDTNETGVGVNYNMYDFGSFEKLLEALKYITGEYKNLKLSLLSKKIYAKLMSKLCTYISVITNTDRVINFFDCIKPFGIFCLDKDVLVNLQPLDRIQSSILVNGHVNIHDNIPLVLPLEKIINLYNLENYACPLPIFCVVGPMPGIFGENIERYSHHITNAYNCQSSIECTKKILDIYSNEDLSTSIYPRYYVHLPYGIGFYIGTPQMTSYGALVECNKQILSYQDFPLVSQLTYTVGTILLGYIYPEGVTFNYNQIKQDDGTFSLYFYSYTYTSHHEWVWKTFTKKQWVTDKDPVLVSQTIPNSQNIPDVFYEAIAKKVEQNIKDVEANLSKYEESATNLMITKEKDHLAYLHKHHQEMKTSKNIIDNRKTVYKHLCDDNIKLQTKLINSFSEFITDVETGQHQNELNIIKDTILNLLGEVKNIQKKIAKEIYIYKDPNHIWHEIPGNNDLIESIINRMNKINPTVIAQYKKELKNIMRGIYDVIEELPQSYRIMYTRLDYISKQEEEVDKEATSKEKEEKHKQTKMVKEESKVLSPMKQDFLSNKVTPKISNEEAEIVDQNSVSDKVTHIKLPMTFSSKTAETNINNIALKSKLRERNKDGNSKKRKVIEVHNIKSSL